MPVTIVATSFQSEPIVTTIEELEPIKRGTKLDIISCTFILPIEHVEVPIVVVSTHVKALEKLVTPKPIPLIILEIGVGAKVTLINNITHVFEVFKTPDTILKPTRIVKG
jgi:hypothetical protein